MERKPNPKRDELKLMSKSIKQLVAEGKYATVNEGLKDIYAKQGHTELHTLYDWNRLGQRIKSGEKALLLWAKPKATTKEKVKADGKTEEEQMEFFPICHVFSQLQLANAIP